MLNDVNTNKIEVSNIGAKALDLDALHVFVAVCDTGSFRQAQSVLSRSTSAISSKIAKLESQIGRPLFERHGRRAYLNNNGTELLSYARRMISLNREIEARFGTSQTAGSVRFGAPDDSTVRWLPAILTTLASTYPAINANIFLGHSSDLMEKIENKILDIALLSVAATDPRHLGIVVHTERLLWVGAASGSAAYKAPVPLALSHEACGLRRAAIDACSSADRNFCIALTSGNCAGQVAAAKADFAVAPLPESLLDKGLEEISPEILPILPDFSLRLVIPPNSEPAAAALGQCVELTLSNSTQFR